MSGCMVLNFQLGLNHNRKIGQELSLSCSKHLLDFKIMVTVSILTYEYGKLGTN